MDFTQATQTVLKLLKAGDIEAARVALDAQVWPLAGKNKAKRTKAHDLGNVIQLAILEQWQRDHPDAN